MGNSVKRGKQPQGVRQACYFLGLPREISKRWNRSDGHQETSMIMWSAVGTRKNGKNFVRLASKCFKCSEFRKVNLVDVYLLFAHNSRRGWCLCFQGSRLTGGNKCVVGCLGSPGCSWKWTVAPKPLISPLPKSPSTKAKFQTTLKDSSTITSFSNNNTVFGSQGNRPPVRIRQRDKTTRFAFRKRACNARVRVSTIWKMPMPHQSCRSKNGHCCDMGGVDHHERGRLGVQLWFVASLAGKKI